MSKIYSFFTNKIYLTYEKNKYKFYNCSLKLGITVGKAILNLNKSLCISKIILFSVVYNDLTKHPYRDQNPQKLY